MPKFDNITKLIFFLLILSNGTAQGMMSDSGSNSVSSDASDASLESILAISGSVFTIITTVVGVIFYLIKYRATTNEITQTLDELEALSVGLRGPLRESSKEIRSRLLKLQKFREHASNKDAGENKLKEILVDYRLLKRKMNLPEDTRTVRELWKSLLRTSNDPAVQAKARDWIKSLEDSLRQENDIRVLELVEHAEAEYRVLTNSNSSLRRRDQLSEKLIELSSNRAAQATEAGSVLLQACFFAKKDQDSDIPTLLFQSNQEALVVLKALGLINFEIGDDYFTLSPNVAEAAIQAADHNSTLSAVDHGLTRLTSKVSNDNTRENMRLQNERLLPYANRLLKYAESHRQKPEILVQYLRVLIYKGSLLTHIPNRIGDYPEPFNEIIALCRTVAYIEGEDSNEEIYTKLSDITAELPILYASALYYLGRQFSYFQLEWNETYSEYFEKCINLCELVEQDSGEKIFWSILAVRQGYPTYVIEHANNPNSEELIEAIGLLEDIRDKSGDYYDEERFKTTLENDKFHALSTNKKLLIGYKLLAEKTKSSNKRREYESCAHDAAKLLRDVLDDKDSSDDAISQAEILRYKMILDKNDSTTSVSSNPYDSSSGSDSYYSRSSPVVFSGYSGSYGSYRDKPQASSSSNKSYHEYNYSS